MNATDSTSERLLVFLLRMTMAWTFLYAASHQVFVPGWSATGFLEHTKTFSGLFSLFTGSVMGPVTSFLVEYGHLLIGLSLLTGFMLRASSIAAIVLMILYWMAHMDFPFITDTNNFIVDSHVVYAIVLGLLIVKRAGHVWGLDEWAARRPVVESSRFLSWATA
jgi:thiosulfate dehydrogenase (quinone) large subunit